jgi:hypothetical protein
MYNAKLTGGRATRLKQRVRCDQATGLSDTPDNQSFITHGENNETIFRFSK